MLGPSIQQAPVQWPGLAVSVSPPARRAEVLRRSGVVSETDEGCPGVAVAAGIPLLRALWSGVGVTVFPSQEPSNGPHHLPESGERETKHGDRPTSVDIERRAVDAVASGGAIGDSSALSRGPCWPRATATDAVRGEAPLTSVAFGDEPDGGCSFSSVSRARSGSGRCVNPPRAQGRTGSRRGPNAHAGGAPSTRIL